MKLGVFNQKQSSELPSGFSGVARVWPQLSEAAITGPLYFPVDFEPWEEGEPGGIQQDNLVSAEEPESKELDSGTGVKTSVRHFKAPKQTRSTWCQGQVKQRPTPAQPCRAGPSSQGSRSSTRPGVPRKERIRSEISTPQAPTRQDWCQLSDILEQQPQFCMKAKEAELLSWIERFESFLVPGSLGYWIANRIPECLEGDEEDTIGILAGIEDVKMQGAAKPKDDCCRILQAKTTSYRSEIRQWLVGNQWHVACLQETHQVELATEAMTSSLRAVALEPWALPAEGTPGGSTGGLVSVSRSLPDALPPQTRRKWQRIRVFRHSISWLGNGDWKPIPGIWCWTRRWCKSRPPGSLSPFLAVTGFHGSSWETGTAHMMNWRLQGFCSQFMGSCWPHWRPQPHRVLQSTLE